MSNNPPAFPGAGDAEGEIDGLKVRYPHRAEGMTLRDYFAAAAMHGWLRAYGASSDYDETAHVCFKYADAMLKEREKQV